MASYPLLSQAPTPVEVELGCDNIKEENVDSNLQDDRDKANHASDMLKKINNKKFIISLAGLCDIYSQFSQMVCELQKVNLLPFERYASYHR